MSAAYFTPGLFDAGGLRAAFVALRPLSTKRWSAEIAMSLPPSAAPGHDAEVGFMVRRGPTVIHADQRSVHLEGSGRIVIREPVEIPPGAYTISVVLSDPLANSPKAVTLEATLADVPRDETFLVPPWLGVQNADAAGIEPLVGPLDAPAPVVAVTQVCAATPDRYPIEPLVARTLRSASGATIGVLPPVAVSLEKTGLVRCASLIDEVPIEALTPGATLVFEASLAKGAAGSSRAIALVVAGPP